MWEEAGHIKREKGLTKRRKMRIPEKEMAGADNFETDKQKPGKLERHQKE